MDSLSGLGEGMNLPMSPAEDYLMKRNIPTQIINSKSNLLERWQWNGPTFTDSTGENWYRLLSGGDNPRAKSVEDATAGRWANNFQDWQDASFEALPMRRESDNMVAYMLFKLWPWERPTGCNSSELVIDYVPCDYSGPDPVMRDVA